MSSQHSNQHKYSRNLTDHLFLISSHYYFTPDSLHTPLSLLFAIQLFLSFINSNSCLLQPLYHVLLFTIVHPHPQRFLHDSKSCLTIWVGPEKRYRHNPHPQKILLDSKKLKIISSPNLGAGRVSKAQVSGSQEVLNLFKITPKHR